MTFKSPGGFSFLKIASLFFLVSALHSCGGTTEESVESENADEFRTYSIDIDKSDVSFTELVDKVEIMYMEETEESLLSYVFRVSREGDKLIFPGGNKGDVYIYTSTGEFVNKFNRNGDGPGEYSSIQSTWVNGDSIIIYDNLKQVLHWYDYEGNELKNMNVPHRATHVYPYHDGYAMDMTFSRIDDSLRYKLLMTDQAFNSRQMLLPYEEDIPFPISTNVNSFKKLEDKIIYKSVFADTTYLLESDGVRPFYAIDFGDRFLWNDESMYENGQAAMSAIPESGKVWIFNAVTGPDKIYMLYNTSFTDFGSILIDRKTGDYQKLNMYRTPEERYSLGAMRWEGDWLFCSIPSTGIEDFLGELDETQWSLKEGTTLEKIESSENPALIWIKFKELP